MVVAAKEKTLSDMCDDGIFGRWWACFTRKKLNNFVEHTLKLFQENRPI